MSYGAAALVNTGVLQFFVGTDAYVSEMTPQLVPLSKLNHNIVLGLGIPLHKRKLYSLFIPRPAAGRRGLSTYTR